MKREKKRQIRNKRRYISRNRHPVYVSGVFDILHVGHLHLFEQAKQYGSFLVVCVNTDEYVSSYKFPPIVEYRLRAKIVGSLKLVDAVMPKNGFFDMRAFKKYGAGFKIKGKEKNLHERDELGKKLDKELAKYDVKHKWVSRIRGYSSTNIKTKILSNMKQHDKEN